MKIYSSLFVLSIVASLFFACNNYSSEEEYESKNIANIENEKTIEELVVEKPVIDDATLEEKLDEILKVNKELIFENLNSLKKAIAIQDKLTTSKEVESVLQIRDTLMHLLNTNNAFYRYMDKGYHFHKEFEALGMLVVEVEDGFAELVQAPFFEKVIEKAADEPLILFNKIKNLDASAYKSEYPYHDLKDEMDLLSLAEKMLTKYSEHKYNKEILKLLTRSLHPLTDVHLVMEKDYKLYLVGGYQATSELETDINEHNAFVENYSQSRFAKVIENIVSNISTLSSDKLDLLYFVKVPELNSEGVFADEKLNEQLANFPREIKEQSSSFKYMWLGVDVPHTFSLGKVNESFEIVVYRFYDQKEPAEKALEKIKKIIPKAELLEYKLNKS